MSSILDKINHQKESSKPINSSSAYFALEISPDVVKAAVWRITNQQLEILNYGSAQPWRQGGVEQLILASDTALSEASVDIDQEPEQVIFGLTETWVNQNRIVEPRRSDLKTLTQKLDLKPIGFVVTHEAINHYLKITEGTPPSVILLNLSATEVIVSLITHGNLEGTQAVGRSDSLSLDVYEGLNRFPVSDYYPPRILLWDGGEELETAQQKLMTFSWTKKSKFQHFPKIEVMPPMVSVASICLAGATELAKAQSISLKDTLIFPDGKTTSSHSKPKAVVAPTVSTKPDKSKPNTPTLPDSTDSSSQSVGSKKALPSLPNSTKDSVSSHAKQLGFTTSESSPEVSAANIPERVQSSETESDPATDPQHDNLKAPTAPFDSSKESSKPQSRSSRLANFITVLGSLTSRFRRSGSKPPVSSAGYRLTPPWQNKLIRFGLILGPVIVGLVLVMGWLWWYVPKLDATILVSPKTLQEEFVFTIDPNSTSTNLENLTIPVTKVNLEKSGSVTVKTSGVGTVGDPAKGKVIIYNKAKNNKTFPANTELVSDNGLKFTLDTETSVASASSTVGDDFIETITPGKAEANVTAAAIGPDSNLKAGQKFIFTDLSASAYVAKNPEAFSGGTAKEVATVSKNDLTKAKNQLSEKLLSEAEAELSTETADKKLIRNSISKKITNQTVSAEVGDEAKELTLEMTTALSGLAYNKEDMVSLARAVIMGKIPAGYKIDQDSFQFNLKTNDTGQADNNQFKAGVSVSLIPEFDIEKITHDIVGKKPDLVGMYLHNMSGVSGVSLKYWPKLPFPLPPQRVENISITTRTQ